MSSPAQCLPCLPYRCPQQSTSATYNALMHIVVIAWLYVTVLMALTETSIVAGIMTLVFYGLLPTMLLLWLFGGSARRRALRVPREETPANSDADHEKPEH
ncbi:MAG: hypothetical protein V5B39_11430 [Accumulibacter sp.]|uniref:hypothetical protein n=1 Tax=Accumulibacter sp. TaxID=2053492 RepID=UPI002FC38FDC